MTAAPELQFQLPPEAIIMQMGMGFIASQALGVAARLRIADHLQKGGKTVSELADLTETHEPSLYRLLRALSSLGILHKDEAERFSSTSLGDLLRSDHPQSLRAAIHMMCDPEHWNAHGNMQQSVKTGEVAFEHTFGTSVFPYFAQHPEAAAVFDDSMTSLSKIVTESVSASYDFSGAQTIADIGGGHGSLLARILQTNPQANGILFDQEHVLAGNVLQAEGVAERVSLVSGDFFQNIPVAADIYLLKFIIHDWNDDQSRQILRNLSQSAPAGAKVLLIETVVEEDDNAPSMSKIMDLNMLVMTGGKERTASEYAKLMDESGFKFVKIHSLMPMQIVEAVKI